MRVTFFSLLSRVCFPFVCCFFCGSVSYSLLSVHFPSGLFRLLRKILIINTDICHGMRTFLSLCFYS